MTDKEQEKLSAEHFPLQFEAIGEKTDSNEMTAANSAGDPIDDTKEQTMPLATEAANTDEEVSTEVNASMTNDEAAGEVTTSPLDPDENEPETATTQQGPKTFITKGAPGVKDHFDEEEVTQRQEDWQRFEEEPQDFSHNIFPEYFYAGFWIRLWAFLVDLICISCITNASLGLLFRLLGKEPDNNFLSFYGLASLAIYLAYFTLLTKLNHGQTIGKMLFGIRVVSLTETELSWLTVIMRETVCRFILKTFPLNAGYLPAAFSKRKQHVGDFFCDTSVVTINVIKAFNKEIRL